MSISREEALRFFTYVEKLSAHDNKITLSDLEKALEVDVDGDGKITDIPQYRPDGTFFTEKGIQKQNVQEWIKNGGIKWANDQALTFEEFWEMVNC
jgi:hypothetical protein